MKMSKNISSVTASGLCLYCGACYSICPADAIFFNDEIDLQPAINNKCIKCGKCLKVCPGLKPLKTDEGDPLLGPIQKCYLGYSSDPEIRFRSSSGGIISSFNKYLLQNKIVDGIICIRQSRESIYKNEVILATSVDQVLSAAGSRYAPAYVCSGFKDLPLKDKGNYAIVGKPCDIQAAIKYTGIAKKYNFFKIAIFCAQTPSMSATRKILKLNNIDDNQVTSIQYRGNGWPGFFTVISKNGEVLFKKEYHVVWNQILCRAKFSNKRCFLCHDCTGENADISVGDAWLDELKGKSDGHSVIITRSEIGEKYINDCIKKIILILNTINPDIIIESQKNLLSKKQNIYLKRLAARLIGQNVPVEEIRYDRTTNHIKKIAGYTKYFILKKIIHNKLYLGGKR